MHIELQTFYQTTGMFFGGKRKTWNNCARIRAITDSWGINFRASFIRSKENLFFFSSIFDYLSNRNYESSFHKNFRFLVGLECGCIHQETFDIICRHVTLRFQGSEEMNQIKGPCRDVFTRRGIRGSSTVTLSAPFHSPMSKQRI